MTTAEATSVEELARLTPDGKAAIASFGLRGPGAVQLVRELFHPLGKRADFDRFLDVVATGKPNDQFWVGRLRARPEEAGEEIVLAWRAMGAGAHFELHCHGGREVMQMIEELFSARSAGVCTWPELLQQTGHSALAVEALRALGEAATVRVAAILLDQQRGAFAAAITQILDHIEQARFDQAARHLQALARWTRLGKHLTRSWRVAILGAPNVGKSSLINRLAGFQRSIVAATPGTTRDVVTVRTAVDGWPVELIDTAGLRSDAEALERQGIDLALEAAATADLCLWVVDASAPPVWPQRELPAVRFLVNKVDLPSFWELASAPVALRVSAATGEGLESLLQALSSWLVPEVPAPGNAVPFTPQLCAGIATAQSLSDAGQWQQVRSLLAALLC